VSAPIDLALRLLPPARKPSAAGELAARVRLVLETAPGKLPYLPELGCDLEGLVGATGGAPRLAEVQQRITGALHRWVPGVRVRSCEVRQVPLAAARAARGATPVAEAALASAGISARLEVHVVVETAEGPIEIETELER
jgi:phage baseplate assembly protein W